MKEVIFVTGNKFKIKVANIFLKDTDIKLVGKKILCPEIQHWTQEDI